MKRLASVAIAGRELGLAQGARRGAVERLCAAVPRGDAALRHDAHLSCGMVRPDVARILSHVGDRVSAEERKVPKRRVAGAAARRTTWRAMSKLAQRG